MVKVKDGIEYEFIKSENDSEVNLVFIHGIGFNKSFFEPIAEEIKEYNSYLIDLPGHGGSVDSGCNFVNYLNTVSDFLRTINNAVVIGHSLGGTIALSIALRRIHTVKAVMVIAGGAESLEYGRELADEINNGLMELDAIKSSLADISDSVSKALEHTEGKKVVVGDVKAGMSINILNSISGIDIPSTIIGCEDDKLYPLEYAKEIYDKINNSKFLVFEDKGSILPLVRKDEIVQEIKEIVNRSGI